MRFSLTGAIRKSRSRCRTSITLAWRATITVSPKRIGSPHHAAIFAPSRAASAGSAGPDNSEPKKPLDAGGVAMSPDMPAPAFAFISPPARYEGGAAQQQRLSCWLHLRIAPANESSRTGVRWTQYYRTTPPASCPCWWSFDSNIRKSPKRDVGPLVVERRRLLLTVVL